jgi:hypothetical protein
LALAPVTGGCPEGHENGHVTHASPTVIATFRNEAHEFCGDWVPGTGLP